MGATAELKQNHKTLQDRLSVVAAGLRTVPPTPKMVRGMCQTLAQVLEQHIAREEQLLAPYAHRLQPVWREQQGYDHADWHAVLQDLTVLRDLDETTPMPLAASYMSQLVEELREHLAEEEREIFPVVAWAETEVVS